MPSIYLYNTTPAQPIQSGSSGTPPDLKVRSGDATPSNIRLYPVSSGILSTLAVFYSVDILLHAVTDDTVPIIIERKSVDIILRQVSQPIIIQSGSDAIPPTLQIYTGETNPSDIRLRGVVKGTPSSKQSLLQSDIKLYDVLNTIISFNLIIDNMSQAQGIDNVAITQVHSLLADDVTQSQSIDDISITQVHILLVQDVQQSQQLGNLDITQLHVLAIDNLSQAQLIDNLDITQAHLLTVQNLSQTQAIDGISITQVHHIPVNNVFQSQVINGITITQVHNLTIQNMLQGGSSSPRHAIRVWDGTQWVLQGYVNSIITYR
jgi:hypothetical protein